MDKSDLIFKVVNKLDSKIDKLDDRMDNLHINMIKNTSDLEEHMARTSASEQRLGHIEDKLTLTYLLKVVSSAVITSGAIAGAIYKIIQVSGN
jgi:hypothetical protein